MTALSVTDFGATANSSGDSRAAFQAALNAAKPGDTVAVPSGTFNISNTLNIPTGVTFTGLSNAVSHVKFNLPFQTYGISINGNASNVTIENLDLSSNSGLLTMNSGSQYTNTHVINNRLQFGGTYANGKYVFGIWGGVLNEGLQINNNYFHDSIKSVRDWEVYYAKDATFDHNTLYNTFDGGHIMEPQDNVSFSYNYGTHIGRMGQEIQGNAASHNLKVVGNTFYDWVHPFFDSFGLSVVNHNAINTLVAGNYLGATIAQGSSWGAADSGGKQRFGYGIEIGAVSSTVENNTLTGNWIAGIVSSRNALVQNNQTWGTYSWGAYTTEGGLDGGGKETLINNTSHASSSGAPAAAANSNNYNVVATGDSSSTTVTTPVVTTPVVTTPASPATTASGINDLAVTVLSDNSVKLTWTNTAGLTNARLSILSTVGRQAFSTVALTDGTTTATISGLHAGWQLDFAITGTNTAGTAINSSVMTAQMTGNGAAVSSSTPTLVTPVVTNPVPPITDPVATAPVVTTPGTTNPVITAPTTPSNALNGLTATVLGNHRVKLTWSTSAPLTSVSVAITTTVGRATFSPVSVDGNISSITIGNLHAGWQYDFTVTAVTATGSMSSGPVTAQTTGNSSAATTGSPMLAASTTVTTQSNSASASIKNVSAAILSDSSIRLSWLVSGATQASAKVGIATTVGRTQFPAIAIADGTASVVISGLHAGWQFDLAISSTTTAGQTIDALPLTVLMPGSSAMAAN